MLIEALEKLIDLYFSIIPRAKPKSKNVQNVCIIAHRGAHNHKQNIIENTHEAFRIAEKLGCFGIELDIHATADHVLVVNHDPTLTRLWGHDVAIANLRFEELRALEPRIPTLKEVVTEYAPKMHLFIELKAPFNHENELVEELKDLTAIKDYHLLTLDADVFLQLTQFPSSALCLVPYVTNVKTFCDLSLKHSYGGVFGSYLLLTQHKINTLKKAKQMCGVGFVESKYSLYREIQRDIPWIFTNNPATILNYLHQLNRA